MQAIRCNCIKKTWFIVVFAQRGQSNREKQGEEKDQWEQTKNGEVWRMDRVLRGGVGEVGTGLLATGEVGLVVGDRGIRRDRGQEG